MCKIGFRIGFPWPPAQHFQPFTAFAIHKKISPVKSKTRLIESSLYHRGRISLQIHNGIKVFGNLCPRNHAIQPVEHSGSIQMDLFGQLYQFSIIFAFQVRIADFLQQISKFALPKETRKAPAFALMLSLAICL